MRKENAGNDLEDDWSVRFKMCEVMGNGFFFLDN